MAPVQSKILAALVALIVTLCLVAGTILATGTAQAGSAAIVSTEAPPPLRAERAPAARDGYVWAPGHWEWNSRSYVWVGGTWIVARPKARWVADSWEQVGAEWHYTPGHWER